MYNVMYVWSADDIEMNWIELNKSGGICHVYCNFYLAVI